MSDPPVRDPVDDAYVEAESLLADDAARAARRARVLAAVTTPREMAAVAAAAAPPPPPAPMPAPLPRRARGVHPGWAAAAAVGVLGVLVATFASRSVAPPPSRTVTAPPAAPQPAVVSGPSQASASPDAERPQAGPPLAEASPAAAEPEGSARARDAATPPSERPARRTALSPAPKDAEAPAASIPTPPPLPIPPVPAPIAQPSTIARPPAGELSDEAAPRSAPRLAGRSEAFQAAAPSEATAGAKLRAAAAAGRTREVEAWLDRGVPVDAAGADGDTALIQSVRANHPAAAALLRRRGANPERTNGAGESAGALAAQRADPRLDQALRPPP